MNNTLISHRSFCLMFLCLTYAALPVLGALSSFRYQESNQRFQITGGEAKPLKAPQPQPKLDVIEVDVPVKIPTEGGCNVLLMQHSFANSYGNPFVGSYKPPPCRFNRIALNFTVLSTGRQFDRLAMMYLNDTEIWRTSTAEPTGNGIIWTYHKDVSNYLSLFKEPQKVIFDLGNIVNDVYTAPFNTTLTATFYHSDESSNPADLIVPISAQRASKNQGSAWSIPEFTAVNKAQIPRNVKRAVLAVAACGQQNEEFWWSNVPSSTTNTFINNTLYGYTPFREVQVLIDGSLAGVVWPFPVIFTGGIVPSFWRPLVGIDSYDLREDEIDVTPWLPMLSDGKPHTYEIRVLGISDDGKGRGALTPVGAYWVVSGKLFLWLDEDEDSITRGIPIVKTVPSPNLKWSFNVGINSLARNTTLDYHVTASRQLSFTSKVITSEGATYASWTQSLSFSNIGNLTAGGYNQTNVQSTTGFEASSSGYSRRYSYPLTVDSSYAQDPVTQEFNITGTLDRGKEVQIIGPAVFPTGIEQFSPEEHAYDGSRLSTRQFGYAGWLAASDPRFTRAWASTEQDFTFKGLFVDDTNRQGLSKVEEGGDVLYRRHVKATNGTIVQDTNPVGRTAGQAESDGNGGQDDEDDDDAADIRSFASTRISSLLMEGGGEAASGPALDAALEVQH